MRSQPSGDEHLGRLFGVVEVAGHDAAAAEQHLARLARPRRRGRPRRRCAPRTPDAAGPRWWRSPRHRRRLGRRAGGATLGQPVAGDDLREGKLVVDAADQLDGDVGRAGHGHAQRREVVPGAVGVVEDGLVQRRRPGQHGDVFRRHPGEHAVDVEDRLGQHGRPAGDAGEDAGLEAEHVEVRVHLEIDVAGAEARSWPPSPWPPISVRPCVMTTPLGTTGRPRGEEDVRRDRPVRGRRCGAAPRPGDSGVAAATKSRHATARPLAAPRATTMVSSAGRATPVRLEHRHVVGAQEVGDRHEHPGPAPGEDVRRLGALEPRVHRDQDRAGREQAERRHDPLGAVAAPDRHPVAGLDACPDQRGAERPGVTGQLARTTGRPPRRGRPPGRRTAPPCCRAWPEWRARRGRGGRLTGPAPRRPGIENGPLSIQ